MTPRRRPRQSWIERINWSGLSFGFTLLIVIVGGLMAYAYLNGSTSTKIVELERRISALEDRNK